MAGIAPRRLMTASRALAAFAFALAFGCGRSLPLVERPPGAPPPTVIRAVAIYDGLASQRTSVRDVLIEDGRIARIAPAGTIRRVAGMLQIDGANRTLLPGLIDVHGHVGTGTAPPWVNEWPDAKRNMQAYLYCGVTTVLDPADLAPDA